MIDPKIVYFIFLGLSLLSVFAMWKMKLLATPAAKPGARLAVMSPLLGFLLFLSTLAYVPRWAEHFMHYLDTHGLTSFSRMELAGWPQLVSIIAAAVVLLGFSCIHAQDAQSRIWSPRSGAKAASLSFITGMGYCLLCYPIVMALVQTIHMAVQSFGYTMVSQQVAIEQLKSLHDVPVLFWSMVVCLVTIVPLIEEFLFRGLLQNFFYGVVGVKTAVVCTSLFFALFHFTSQQGYTNIELMIGLFVYSFFMGVFYVRTSSLWVPIGMHAMFNGLSILLMVYAG